MKEKYKVFLKKLDNFWYHYKIVTLLIAFFAACAVFLISDYLRKEDPDIVISYVSETYGSEMQFHTVNDTLTSIVGDINGDGRARINYRFMVIRKGLMDSFGLAKENQFNYSFLDKAVRLYILEPSFFESKEAYFEPLEGILPAEHLANGLVNAEGQICAVPLFGSAVASEMDLARPELYIALKRQIDAEKRDEFLPVRHERAKRVLQYIIEGEQ